MTSEQPPEWVKAPDHPDDWSARIARQSPVMDTGIVAFIEARLDEREKRARQNMNWNTKFGVRQKAEVAKDRAILALHRPENWLSGKVACVICCDEDDESRMVPTDYPCQTVRLLAAIDADREGYDPAWKPQAS